MSSSKLFLLLSICSLALSSPVLIQDPQPLGRDLCGSCVVFAIDSLEYLYNRVVNNYILTDCRDLCDGLPAELEKLFCKSFCEYVGIKAFTDAVKSADLDPIYFCEVIGQCPVVNGGALTITSTTVTPTNALLGAVFTIGINVQVTQRTSTGYIRVTVQPPAPYDSFSMENLNTGFAVGPFVQNFSVKSDGPVDDNNNPFPAGNYGVTINICSGTCGSNKAHAFLLANSTGSFAITSS